MGDWLRRPYAWLQDPGDAPRNHNGDQNVSQTNSERVDNRNDESGDQMDADATGFPEIDDRRIPRGIRMDVVNLWAVAGFPIIIDDDTIEWPRCKWLGPENGRRLAYKNVVPSKVGPVAQAGNKVTFRYVMYDAQSQHIKDSNENCELTLGSNDHPYGGGIEQVIRGMKRKETRRLAVPPGLGPNEISQNRQRSWQVYDVMVLGITSGN